MTEVKNTFNIREKDGVLRVSAPEHLDAAAQPQFAEILKSIDGSNATVELDLKSTTFLDSAGVGFIVSAHRGCDQSGGKLSIVGAANQPRKLLAALNVDQHIDVKD